jgi:hypothetical protein
MTKTFVKLQRTSGVADSKPNTVRRLLRFAILVVVALLAGTGTTVSAAVFTYDAESNARVDAQVFGRAEASPTQLSDVREGSASRPFEAGGASTTPSHALVATNTGPDFVAGPAGSHPPVPVSQSRMAAGLDEAGFPSAPTRAPGTEYTLPDGSKVRLMQPSGQAPLRASFTNGNGQAINPFTGKPVQPPAPPGVTMKEWVRLNTHVDQTP